ncbi:MAG: amidohydrolase [Candidatus Hydrogenedentes bacterium]|nr:amidohydrolase [Candidatus Hydrogenedentota bacterium]
MQPVIDVWMQHPTARFVKQPMFASLLRWLGTEDMPAVPVEFTIGAMEAAGVAKGMLAAWCGPQGWLIDHDEVAAIAEAWPQRIVPIASANLYEPMAAVRELRRCVKLLGFRGLRIVPWLWDLPPDDRRYYPLYAECCELDIPFCTQVGHTGPLCPSEPGRPIPYLDRVALEFPDLKIVAGHVGFPWTNEIISLATKYPNVYIDTSAYKVKRLPQELVEYMRRHGRKKVMFGTNYPMLTAEACLADLDSLGLDEEACRMFLHENAARVFKVAS